MKKVIITGASGFIGKALTKYLLDKDVSVYAIVREPSKLSEFSSYTNLHIITCNMHEYSSLDKKITERDFDACFHFAWEGVNNYNNNIQIANIQNSVDLIEVLNTMGIKKFMFFNTISQYKYFKTSFDDYSIVSNFDIYGVVKKSTGEIIQKRCLEYNISYYNILFPNVYGVGDYSKRSTNMIINFFQTNVEPKLADASILYDWTYIDDAIEAIYIVAEKGKPFKSYYIGSRKLDTLETIITKVRDTVNPSIKLTFGTYHDISFIDYDNFFNDNLYQDTGFEITSDFAENIRKTAEWVKTLNL